MLVLFLSGLGKAHLKSVMIRCAKLPFFLNNFPTLTCYDAIFGTFFPSTKIYRINLSVYYSRVLSVVLVSVFCNSKSEMSSVMLLSFLDFRRFI